MMKRKRINPKFATLFRLGIDSGGKMVAVKPGIRPNTDGPKRMPPKTSPTTLGSLR
jgi:hypothetical protein